MTCLVDAHTLLWAIYDQAKLSTAVYDIVRNADNDLLVSEATLWELLNKVGRGRLEYTRAGVPTVHDLVTALGVNYTAILQADIITAASLPHHHSDPFDRLLIAQAMRLNLPILTTDSMFAHYSIHTIW